MSKAEETTRARESRCKACGALIRWIRMPGGSSVPLDCQAPVFLRIHDPDREAAKGLNRHMWAEALPDSDGTPIALVDHRQVCKAAQAKRRAS